MLNNKEATLKESDLRKIIKILLEDRSLGPSMVNVNPVVDTSAYMTDPGNPNYKPGSKAELRVALSGMVEDMPDESVPGVYDKIKQALAAKEDEEGKKQMEKSNKKVEESIRLEIRRMLSEADLPPVKKIPYGVSGIQRGPESPAVKGLRRTLEKMKDIDDEYEDPDAPAAGRGRKNVMMTDVSGASFDEIAKELGFAGASGAKKAVMTALAKAKFIGTMDPDDLEIIVLRAMSDYVKALESTNELSPADIKLLKDHPDIVRELEGFREFLDDAIKKARKASEV